jgi:hypothetical protein
METGVVPFFRPATKFSDYFQIRQRVGAAGKSIVCTEVIKIEG